MNLSRKIELLIQKKQMSSSQFADKLGIPRSSISHILSGRNKPSLDVVQKILSNFPEISAEELLFEDQTLKILNSTSSNFQEQDLLKENLTIGTLFDQNLTEPSESNKKIILESDTVQPNLRRSKERQEKEPSPSENVSKPVNSIAKSSQINQLNEFTNTYPSTHLNKQIERVIIFYSDGTFTESKASN
ncbi:MAG: helix-turn-helix transcriptional regulator [Aquirufa sp.]